MTKWMKTFARVLSAAFAVAAAAPHNPGSIFYRPDPLQGMPGHKRLTFREALRGVREGDSDEKIRKLMGPKAG